ncbi:O-antigen ligase family protein [Patescibacteria group bacterium]
MQSGVFSRRVLSLGLALFAALAIGFGFFSVDNINPIVDILVMLTFGIIALYWYQHGKAVWLLYLFVLLQPFVILHIPVFGPAKLQHALLAILGIIFITDLLRKKISYIRFGSLFAPILLFVFIAGISTILNRAETEEFRSILILLSNLAFYLLAINYIRSSKKLWHLVSSWLAAVFLLTLSGVAFYIHARYTGAFYADYFQYSPADNLLRLSSFAVDSNFFANHLVFVIPILLALILTKKLAISKLKKYSLWFFAVLATSGIFLSYSRGALIALAVTLLAYIFFEKGYKHYLNWAKLFLVVVAAFALSIIIQPDFLKSFITRIPVQDQYQSEKTEIANKLDLRIEKESLRNRKVVVFTQKKRDVSREAIDVRIVLWDTGIRIFQDHMWLGVGTGNFPTYFKKYADQEKYGHLNSLGIHNAYLEVLVEHGIVGLLSFVLLLFFVLRNIWIRYQNSQGMMKVLAFGFLITAIAHLIHLLFKDGGLYLTSTWLLITVSGIMEFLPPQKDSHEKTN